MNALVTRIESAILFNPRVELVPAAPSEKGLSWRDHAKKGDRSMFWSIEGDVVAGDQTVHVTVNSVRAAFTDSGELVWLGVEPDGLDKEGNPLPKSMISQYQAIHCASFHVEDGEIKFDEAPIIDDQGNEVPFDFVFGVKHFVFVANGKTLCLKNLRLDYKADDPRFARGHCDDYEVVDAPKAVAKGPASALGARAPKAVEYRTAARPTATATPATTALKM